MLLIMRYKNIKHKESEIMMGMSRKKPLYVVGIDGVPLWILNELKKKKGMEGFARLMEKGMMSEMRSTLLPLTGPAWPSIYTGLKPSEHQVPDFVVLKKEYVLDAAFFDSSRFPPFYHKLAERGFRCLVLTPAMDTRLPPKRLDANLAMTTGFPLEPAKSNSEELRRLMRELNYYGEPNIEEKLRKGELSSAEGARIYAESVRKNSEMARRMMGKTDYDLVFVCFAETDRIHHFLLGERKWREYLLQVYSEVSKFLEYLMGIAERNGGTVIIVSDHGAQRIHRKFLVNSWLVKKGYAELKRLSTKPISSREELRSVTPSLRYKMRESLLNSFYLLRFYDVLPYTWKLIASAMLATLAPRGVEGTYTRILLSDFEMRGTRAFAAVTSFPFTTIWINDRRFVSGVVGTKERARLKRELVRELGEVKSYEGDRMFVKIFDGSEYYETTERYVAPDIIAQAKPGYTIDPYFFSNGTLFMDPEKAKSGDHIVKGIFGLAGSDAKRIKLKKDMSVLDVSPIVLKHFGVR